MSAFTQYVYLGFIKSLQSIFRKTLETVLVPVLTDILAIFVNSVTSVIWNLLAELLVNPFTALYSVTDFIEGIFNVSPGVTSVTASNQRMALLQAIFKMKGISTAFLYVTTMAVAICIIFTICKTVRSISDMALDDGNPVSRVMTDAIRATVTFMMVPFLCVFLLRMSSATTKQVNVAFPTIQGTNGSIGSIVFLATGMDADKSTIRVKGMFTGQIKKSADRAPTSSNSIRGSCMDGIRDYQGLTQIRTDFHVSNLDYIIDFVTVILLILVLTAVVLKFTRRISELFLLYLAPSLYISTIPLDDGVISARQRELFIAKFLSGFSSIFAMKYYLMVVPHFTSSDLILYGSKLPNGTMIGNVLQVFLIVGGIWAMYHGQTLIMDTLAPQILFEEKQMGLMVIGFLTRGTAMALSTAQMGAASTMDHMKDAAGEMGQGAASGKSGGKEDRDNGQKFTGS